MSSWFPLGASLPFEGAGENATPELLNKASASVTSPARAHCFMTSSRVWRDGCMPMAVIRLSILVARPGDSIDRALVNEFSACCWMFECFLAMLLTRSRASSSLPQRVHTEIRMLCIWSDGVTHSSRDC